MKVGLQLRANIPFVHGQLSDVEVQELRYGTQPRRIKTGGLPVLRSEPCQQRVQPLMARDKGGEELITELFPIRDGCLRVCLRVHRRQALRWGGVPLETASNNQTEVIGLWHQVSQDVSHLPL